MRLIDAEALLKRKMWARIWEGTIYETKARVVTVGFIQDAPTIEAEPVKHGRWKEHGYKWQCSSCGILMDIDGTPKENLLNYCPNCGAKMDLEDEA